MWLVTLTLLVILVSLIWAYAKYRHNYWAARGVPTFPDTSTIFGHWHKLMSKEIPRWKYIDEIYKNHGGSRFCGLYEFYTPILMVGDPEFVKAILIKDFDHFVDRRNFQFPLKEDEILNHFLTNATGSHWKGVRSVLSPSFTSGRMKGMYPLVLKKADALVDYLHKHREEDSSSIAVKKLFGLYTLEVIASCAFGIESNSLEDDNSIFNQKAAGLFSISTLRMFKFFLFMLSPKILEYLRITFAAPETFFFTDIVKESMAQRRAGLHRGDFLDLMMEAQRDLENPSSKIPKYPLSENIIVANSVLFILAGYDTAANTLSFWTFLLAKHHEIQERLREEINNIIQENGDLTYQGIMEAKFLDACLSETLRLYSPAHFTERKCTKEYRLSGTDVVIPKNGCVSIPVDSIHHDERFWPEPNEFQPDRFMPENKENIKSGTYLPFGLGPRNCIGMRFAQMEVKLVIARILMNFQLRCAPGCEELRFDTTPGIRRPSEDFKVVFDPINK